MVTRSGSRRYYVVSDGRATVRPRFDAELSLRDNVVVIATWEWGDRRAQWAGALVDELQVADDAADSAQWVAAVLCAAAVDSGRDRRTGWSRTVTALSEMTGVPRDLILSGFAQLRAIQVERQSTGIVSPAGSLAVDDSVRVEPAGAA